MRNRHDKEMDMMKNLEVRRIIIARDLIRSR